MTSITASRERRGLAAWLASPSWPALWGGATRSLGFLHRRLRKPQRLPARPPRVAGDPYAAHRAALWRFGDTMMEAAQAAREPITVVMFEQADLPELHAVFGGTAARALAARFNQSLQDLAGARGLAIRSGATTWTVLLPGLGHAQALAAVKRVLGTGLAVEADTDADEILLVPRMGLTMVDRETGSMREVYRQLREKIAQSLQLERLREAYLRRERESHSRPARLGATAPAPAAR